MMKKQTAVEYLHGRIKDKSVLMQNSEGYYICIRVGALEEIINQSQQMEREQTEEAWNSASGGDAYYTGYEYYKQTYSK